MTWEKIVPPRHDCQMPETNNTHGAGSVWRCDHCGSRYTFRGKGNGGWMRFPEPIPGDDPTGKPWWRRR